MIIRPGIPEELRWFYEARFGMFVHFGIYALLGRGEWVMYHENIPRDEYEKLAPRFNPSRFDAEAWVRLAEESGARYITVTAKHHDGFCLFDSVLTDWKITNTPFRRDLIGELVHACRRRGMRIIFYYSQPDWHHPSFVQRPGAFKDLPHPPPTDRPDWPRYLEYYVGQVRELCTNYGKIDGIWFDGSHKTEEDWHGREVYEMIKRLQPGAIVNDRARFGDMFTPERSLPDDLVGFLFEACESTSPTSWGYQGDTALFSVPHLVESLVKMAAAGGNCLLNVGPAPDGTIPDGQAERMHGVGRWLARYGESIYRTDAGPKLADDNLRVTRRGETAYVHLLRWPATDRIRIPGIARTDVAGARLLPDGPALAVAETADGVDLVGLPGMPPEPWVNVVRLDLARVPESFIRRPPQPVPGPTVAVGPDAPTELAPEAAELEGYGVKGARLRVRRDESTDASTRASFITGWMVPEHAAHWNVSCKTAVACAVSVRVRPHRAGLDGATFAVLAGDQRLTGRVPPTGDPPAFREINLGTLHLAAGTSRITLRPEELLWGYLLADIGPIMLRPVGT